MSEEQNATPHVRRAMIFGTADDAVYFSAYVERRKTQLNTLRRRDQKRWSPPYILELLDENNNVIGVVEASSPPTPFDGEIEA